MEEAKYVVCFGEDPYIFPAWKTHAAFAMLVTNDISNITSAGFCRINAAGEYVCYGRSDSLGVKSQPTDSQLFNRILGGRHKEL